jgi:hypothetical protein
MMTAYHAELSQRCSAMQTEMKALAEAMSSLRRFHGRAPQARSSGGGRLAARGEGGSLKDFITRVLSAAGTSMRLTEVSRAVKKAGYPTKSKNLPNQVSMALAAMGKKNLVRKTGRGLYRV